MKHHSTSRPIALTIAGSDSSGGAGIQADLKTFSAFGVYGASVLTALTAQNTKGVQSIHIPPAAFIGQQLHSVNSDLDIKAIKTGMLANAEIIAYVAEALAQFPHIPLVVDPVMVATSGDRLLAQEAETALKTQLFPLASLITPNLDEAAALLNTKRAQTREEMIAQGHALQGLGVSAVLVKGGHLNASGTIQTADDVLVTPHQVHWFNRARVETKNTHGTGCTLSAAIAAGLAQGSMQIEAIEKAKTYITEALIAGTRLEVGEGHGPVDHLIDVASL